MIRLLLSISFFFLFITTYGQNTPIDTFSLVKSEPFNTTKKENFNGFIGSNEQAIFTIDYLQINRKKQELNLRKFDKYDLRPVDIKNLFTVIDERFVNEPTEIFFQRDTIYLFSKLTGIKDPFNLVYLEMFNSNGDLINERIVDTLKEDDQFYLTESEEKNGFLFTHHNKYDNVYEQKVHLEAIATSGETTWKNLLESPSALQNVEIKEILYSQKSPIYLLCDYGFDIGVGGREEGDLINNNYAIWAYDHQSKFLKEFDLRLKNKWINGIKMSYNKKGDLIVGGFINESRNYSINGTFSLRIDKHMDVARTNFFKYKKSFYAKFVEPKRLDKTKELDDIVIRDILIMEDGSYYIIGEHYYKYTERNYDPRTNITTTTDNYNYNSIVVAYFDDIGNHLWSDRIPKFQHSVNDGGYFSSYSTMQLKNELYLFFNDSDKNNALKADDYFNYKSLYSNRKFQVTYVNIDKEGVVKRGALVSSSNNDYMLRAKQSYQIEGNAMYLSTEIGKTRRLFGIRFE